MRGRRCGSRTGRCRRRLPGHYFREVSVGILSPLMSFLGEKRLTESRWTWRNRREPDSSRAIRRWVVGTASTPPLPLPCQIEA